MKKICPECAEMTEQTIESRASVISVRGENFEVNEEFFKCNACQLESIGPTLSDPVIAANILYRARHGMVTPEEIQEHRRSLGLTQGEFGGLIDMSPATISLYENGKLADSANDTVLKNAIHEPGFLRNKLERSNKLPFEKKKKLLELLDDQISSKKTNLRGIVESMFSKTSRSKYSGKREFNIDKLLNTQSRDISKIYSDLI